MWGYSVKMYSIDQKPISSTCSTLSSLVDCSFQEEDITGDEKMEEDITGDEKVEHQMDKCGGYIVKCAHLIGNPFLPCFQLSVVEETEEDITGDEKMEEGDVEKEKDRFWGYSVEMHSIELQCFQVSVGCMAMGCSNRRRTRSRRVRRNQCQAIQAIQATHALSANLSRRRRPACC